MVSSGAVDGNLPGPKTRLALLGLSGIAMFSCFWVLVSIALNPALNLVYNVQGARYGGPLTWPSRWLHLASLSKDSRSVLYVVLMITLTAAYVFVIYLVRRDNRRSVTLLLAGGFLAFSLLLLFIPPLISQDVYSYAFHGRAMSVYHANPYILVPAARHTDIMYPLIGWRYNASVYGPLFNFFSYIVVRAAGNSIAANVLGFKVMAFVFFAATFPLVYSLARRVSPGRQNLALAAAFWCPILLLHVSGGGHNEPVMFFFVVAGFYAYRRDYPLFGLFLVVLAAMIKISAVLALGPYLVLHVLRDARGRFGPRLAAAAAIVIGIPALMYLPFWSGSAVLNSTRHMLNMYSYSSIPMLTKTVLAKVLTGIGLSASAAVSLSNSLTHAFFLLLMAAIALLLLARTRDFRSMVVATAGITLAWFLTADYILPWYLGLGLVVTGIAGWNSTTGCTIAAAGVFSLYKVPTLHLEKALRFPVQGLKEAPTSHLSLPLLIILVVWLVSIKPFRRPRRAPGETLDVMESVNEP